MTPLITYVLQLFGQWIPHLSYGLHKKYEGWEKLIRMVQLLYIHTPIQREYIYEDSLYISNISKELHTHIHANHHYLHNRPWSSRFSEPC